MTTLWVILITAIAYAVGCLNGADLAGRFIYRSDRIYLGVRGYAALVREYGMGAQAIVAVFDILRALLVTWLGGLMLKSIDCVVLGRTLAAFALLMGCSFPITNGCKGVRSPLCGITAVLLTDWRVGIFCVIVYLVAAILSKSQAIGVIGAGVCFPLGLLVFKTMGTAVLVALLAVVALGARYGSRFCKDLQAMSSRIGTDETRDEDEE